ncbi:phosphatidylinositol phosphatase PTPRQ-like isoform X2 [Glandiceps talaboti]
MSPSTIHSSWSQPTYVYCQVERFELVYKQISDYKCGEWQTIETRYLNADTYDYRIQDLYAHTEYSITVTALTTDGFQISSSVDETTLESGPSIPTDLKSRGISATDLNTTWNPPDCPNGIITSYTVYYWETDNKENIGSITIYTDNIDNTDSIARVRYVIRGLNSDTHYTLQAVAENGCCTSENSSEATAVTKHIWFQRKGKAIRTGLFHKISTKKVTLTWK